MPGESGRDLYASPTGFNGFLLFLCLWCYDRRTGTQFSKTVHLMMTLHVVLYHPLFNPLIYGLKMKEVSKHIKRLFCQDKQN